MGFERLAGQELLINVLQSSMAEGKLSHAILFTGPQGSGKSTIALLLAQALNCTGEPVPCDECNSCRSVANGHHPDVVVVEKEGRWIKIDQLREVKKRFFFFSHGAGNRVCLIEDAHNFTPEAAASLLKILEDPPDRLIFILTTAYPSRLPVTILSRCQHYVMKRVSEEKIRDILKKVKPEATQEELTLAVKLGEGIPGRARDILSKDEWAERRNLVNALGQKIVTGHITEKELFSEAKIWTERKDISQLLELLSFFFKDGLFWSLCRDSRIITDNTLQPFWEKINVDAYILKDCIETLNNTRKMLQTNVNLILAVENVFLQIRGRIRNV